MFKSFILTICLLISCSCYSSAQLKDINVLRTIYANAKTDSAKQDACLDLMLYYNEVNRDSAFYYIEKRLAIAKKSGYKILEASILNNKSYQKIQTGKYADALKCIMESLKITSDASLPEINKWRISQFPVPGNERLLVLSSTMHQFGLLMRETENLDKEIEYFKKALSIASKVNHLDRLMVTSMNIGSAYFRKGLLDSAMHYGLLSDSIASLPAFKGVFRGRNLANMGDIYAKSGDFEKARAFYQKGLVISEKLNNQFNVAVTKHKLSQLFLKMNQYDSALTYAKDNLALFSILNNGANFQLNLGSVYEDIYLAYKNLEKKDSAYKYLTLTFQMKDSLYKIRIANLSAFQNVSFDETLRLENLEKEKIQTESDIKFYSLVAGLIVVSFIGIILYRNNVQRKKSNMLLQLQKTEIELQKMQVEEAIEQLKSTQSQLLQSEKMASLGELTAGVAHEIQNPLNFVNNFSEVSSELIEEMKTELDKGDIAEAKVIASDVQQNLSKIVHHGKRADSIVKGMLQHSRGSSGQKELTDINALCDEYLRLSYHGLRAKDKQFQANFSTHFDENIKMVSVLKQELGRVVLNLINNAFYAVNEMSKKASSDYKPTVSLSTKKVAESVQIEVTDNGNGIPDSIKGKIFQPFFTTKPTGEGTGLGLSLSYDIITKGHGGQLFVNSESGKGTTFTILIPVN